MSELYYNTVTPTLLRILKELMAAQPFESFRLVGGTSLSLHRGHRKSIDIDLFTDAPYGSIDFAKLDEYLRMQYAYVEQPHAGTVVGMGQPYFIGNSELDSIKVDIFYTDNFIQPYEEVDGIRLATVEEIITMKLEVISRIGRKKDFWDIHELIGMYTLKDMLALHEQRYPYGHDRQQIIDNFTRFERADEEPDPDCLRAYLWNDIKLGLVDFVAVYS